MDERGRLNLPSVLRQALDLHGVGTLVLSCYGESIWAWTPEDYARDVEARVAEQDQFSASTMDFVHALCSLAQDAEVDKAGRIRLPVELREEAGIGKDVVVFTTPNHVEIWNAEAWRRRLTEARGRIATRLSGEGGAA